MLKILLVYSTSNRQKWNRLDSSIHNYVVPPLSYTFIFNFFFSNSIFLQFKQICLDKATENTKYLMIKSLAYCKLVGWNAADCTVKRCSTGEKTCTDERTKTTCAWVRIKFSFDWPLCLQILSYARLQMQLGQMEDLNSWYVIRS